MEMRLTFHGFDTLGFRSFNDTMIWVRDFAGGVNMTQIVIEFQTITVSPRGPVRSVLGSNYANFATQWFFIDDPAFLEFMDDIENKKGDRIQIGASGFITYNSSMHIIIHHWTHGRNGKVVVDIPQVPVINRKGAIFAGALGTSSASGKIKKVSRVIDRNARALIDNIM